MSIRIFDLRVFAVSFLLVALAMFAVMRAQTGVVGPADVDHPQGLAAYPQSDCGLNFFKVFVTPGGEPCFIRTNSAKTVEDEMQAQDPAIFDDVIDYVTPERWGLAVSRALKALGW